MKKRTSYDELRDILKSSVTMFDVVELLGLEPPDRQGKIRSIFGEDKTPSLQLYDDHWFDYSTGKYGDQITFVREFTGCSYGEAISKLSGNVKVGDYRKKRRAPKIEKIDLTDRFVEEPEGNAEAYERAAQWVEEKWPVLTLNDLLGFGVKVTQHSLWVPHKDQDGIVRGIKVRDTHSGGKVAVTGSQFRHVLYSVRRPSYQPVALLLEGESDTWCAESWVRKQSLEHKIMTYGLPSGAAVWNNDWHHDLNRHDYVGVALDDDEPGRGASARIRESIGYKRSTVVPIPGGRFAEAMVSADSWLLPLVEQYVAGNN
jgi:hypothetical protein